ncbi:WD repeat-containing protein 76-like [Ornithodoros turicata]|uniref:WD repeat-containing protein 76-like n=1 Tax=Ornithodoros turicata TaxID=34597 RepID=UPI00313A47DF
MRADSSESIQSFSFYGARTMITRSKGTKRSSSWRVNKDVEHERTDVDPLHEMERGTAKRPKLEKKGKGDKKKTDSNDFDAIRQRNIEEKNAFLQSLNIDGLKLGLVSSKKTTPTSIRKKPKVEALPRRQSLRLQSKEPSNEVSHTFEAPVEGVLKVERVGPLDFKAVFEGSTEAEQSFLLEETTSSMLKTALPPLTKENIRDLERYKNAFRNMTVDGTCIEKLTVHRITCLAVHPSKDVTLACAGDKRGYLGFFKLGKDGAENIVETYSPHAAGVMCLKIRRDAPRYIYSGSYDETIRRADIETGIFEEIYRAPIDSGVLYFAWDGPSTMTVSFNDGHVSFVDTRMAGDQVTRYDVHSHRVRTVDVHPSQSQYFVTASTDRLAKIWDRRKMSKRQPEPIATLQHRRSCTSAFFSPVSGDKVVTTSMDNTLRVFNSSNFIGDIKMTTCIKHLNETGRWLTPFRATWVPQSDDVFLVGSMLHPRCIEAYTTHGSLMHKFVGESFGSVCSVVDMHPEQSILACGNSSGKVYIFKEM